MTTTKTTYHRSYDVCGEETSASIKRHISALFGFKYRSIVLLEASYDCFMFADTVYHYCVSVAFSVNGIGYETDFETLVMSEAYSA